MKTAALLFVALLMFAPAFAHPPSDLQARLDEWIKGQPGAVAVAWVDADGATFLQAGKFSATDTRPITPDTQFELGSVTKVFTALLLAESERLGKVDRHDPAAKYLLPPDDPDQAVLAKITLLSLATHTSGLPRLPSNIGLHPDSKADPYSSYDRAMLVEALRQDGRTAPAGGAMAYSNFGAAVEGEALAAAWGTSYADALREHVLAPLGLKVTTLGMAGSPPPADLAPGQVGDRQEPNWTFQAFAPAGALRSSTRDMAVFLRACLGGDKTSLRPAIDATLQLQHTADEVGGHIGLGWLLTDDADHPVVWHNGITAGSHAFIAFCPKTGTGVAILANVQQASEALGFSLLGVKPPQPKTGRTANAAGYVGRYRLSPTFAIEITDVNGVPRGQATGQPAFGMRTIAGDRFAIVGVPAEISFERDPAGMVVALVLHQNGQDQRAPRGELEPPPKEAVLPVETLREYVGDYPITPTFVLSVTEKAGTLSVQATGQPMLPVFASSRDEFFYKIVNAQISFQHDKSGKVTGLILHQNGRNMAAEKKQ